MFTVVTEAGNGTGEEDWMVKDAAGLIVFLGDVFECCRWVSRERRRI